jgi:hypothetical protein
MDDEGHSTFVVVDVDGKAYQITNCRRDCTYTNEFQYWPFVQDAASTVHSNPNVEFD